MRGVGLTYRGKPVAMDPGFSIDWEFFNDPYDFESLARGYSYSISIPRAGNENIFYHLGEPDNTQSFEEIDGFEITIDGNSWQLCNFKPEGVSDDLRYYEGTLSTIDNSVFLNKGRSITELISKLISVPAGSAQEILDSFNEDPNAEMVFPYLHFFGEFGDSPENLVNDGATSFAFFLPGFRILDLLKWSVEGIGYQLIINGISTTSDAYKTLLFSNKVEQIGELIARPTQDVTKYCLDITLGELIREIQFLFKVKPFIDSDNKKLIFNPIIETEDNNELDLTINLDRGIPRKSNFQHFSFGYNLGEDRLLENIPESFTGTNRGILDDITDLEGIGSPAIGDYAYIKRENSYWQWRAKETGGGSIVDLIGEPFAKMKTGTTDLFDFESDFLPCRVSRYSYRHFENGYDIVDNGSGKIRIEGVHGVPVLTLNFNDYKVQFSNSENDLYDFGANEYFDILASSADYIDIDLAFSREVKADSFTMRLELDYYVPIIGDGYHFPGYGIENKDFKGRILIWHGMQADIPDTGTYPFASAHYLDTQLTDIGDMSLNTTGTKSLKERIFDPMVNLLTSSRIMKFIGSRVSPEQLKKLFAGKVARFAKGKFKMISFRCSVTKDGIRDQEIEGYRL